VRVHAALAVPGAFDVSGRISAEGMARFVFPRLFR